MIVYMIVDMEGATGIVHRDQIFRSSADYGDGQKLLMGDVLAAIEGAKDAGASRIVISEGHAHMRNLILDQMPEGVEVVYGPSKYKPHCQYFDLKTLGLESADAAVFVGFHAQAGNPVGILSHTWSGAVVHHLKVNGVAWGETAINAMLLSERGVPLVAVTGDDQLALEVTSTVGPWVRSIEVKKALGNRLALCQTPATTRKKIREGVASAIKNKSSAKLMPQARSFSIELGFHLAESCTKAMKIAGLGNSNLERISDREVTFRTENFHDAAAQAWALIGQAMVNDDGWYS